MSHYLLSVHSSNDGASHAESMSEDAMQELMAGINALESEMEAEGAFVFTGGLHGADAATVVRSRDGEHVMTDGPYVEAKEHIAGFYVIDADDLDEALVWAGKVVDTIGAPIEVRPFFDSRSL